MSLLESFAFIFFGNGDLLFLVILRFVLACLFSMRDIISTFKTCFASSFGHKVSDSFSLALWLLKRLYLVMGFWRGIIEVVEFLNFEHCLVSNLSILTPWGRVSILMMDLTEIGGETYVEWDPAVYVVFTFPRIFGFGDFFCSSIMISLSKSDPEPRYIYPMTGMDWIFSESPNVSGTISSMTQLLFRTQSFPKWH